MVNEQMNCFVSFGCEWEILIGWGYFGEIREVYVVSILSTERVNWKSNKREGLVANFRCMNRNIQQNM